VLMESHLLETVADDAASLPLGAVS
jgi:hypothetical protein